MSDVQNTCSSFTYRFKAYCKKLHQETTRGQTLIHISFSFFSPLTYAQSAPRPFAPCERSKMHLGYIWLQSCANLTSSKLQQNTPGNSSHKTFVGLAVSEVNEDTDSISK